jgi:hypothetical protein
MSNHKKIDTCLQIGSILKRINMKEKIIPLLVALSLLLYQFLAIKEKLETVKRALKNQIYNYYDRKKPNN